LCRASEWRPTAPGTCPLDIGSTGNPCAQRLLVGHLDAASPVSARTVHAGSCGGRGWWGRCGDWGCCPTRYDRTFILCSRVSSKSVLGVVCVCLCGSVSVLACACCASAEGRMISEMRDQASELREQARRAERGAMQESRAGGREGMNERVHAYVTQTRAGQYVAISGSSCLSLGV